MPRSRDGQLFSKAVHTLAKLFTLEQMGTVLTKWLSPDTPRATREPPSLVARSPAGSDPIDDQILDALRRLQRGGRPDIVQQAVQSFLKSAAELWQIGDRRGAGSAA